MQSYLGRFLHVDTLDDINLTIRWPVGACGPEGRPDTAGISGHVGNVCNQKAVVKLDIGHDTSRRAATSSVCVGMVNSEVDISIGLNLGQASRLSGIIIQVLDESNVWSV